MIHSGWGLFLPGSAIALLYVVVIFAMDLICFINYGWQFLRSVPLTYAVCLDKQVPIRFLFSVEWRSWCIVPLNQPFLQSDSRRSYTDVPPQCCSDNCAGSRSPVPASTG